MSEWTVRKTAHELRPGERFVFAKDLGGEGDVVTVESVSADMFGTTEVETEELDFTLNLGTKQWVTIAPAEKSETPVPQWPMPADCEYIERREKLAEFLCNLVYGEGAWQEAGEDTQLNYRLDADDIITANPHLLSLEERERLDKEERRRK